MARNLNTSVSYRVLAAFFASACVVTPALAADDQPIELGPVKVQDKARRIRKTMTPDCRFCPPPCRTRRKP